MKLVGNYAVEKLVSAMQGQFSFTWNTDSKTGISSAIMELFMLRIVIEATDTPVLSIYLIQSIHNTTVNKLLITLTGKNKLE